MLAVLVYMGFQSTDTNRQYIRHVSRHAWSLIYNPEALRIKGEALMFNAWLSGL